MATINPTEEGTIDFTYQGETYQTWYKVYGDIKNGSRTPLVVLHGGPGMSHDYLIPMSDLTPLANIPTIFYDQVGNARSTHIRDKPKTFWSAEIFIEELENLLNHFGISECFDLYGHSWGGILATEFEVRKQPAGLRKLVLSNTLAAFSLWKDSMKQLVQPFPADVQDALEKGMADPERYRPALEKFQGVHNCPIEPRPKEYVDSLEWIFGPEGNPAIVGSGMLEGWSVIDRLHLVRPPTLLVNGSKDIAQDFVVRPYFDHICKIKWITLDGVAHCPFWEVREKYMKLVNDFLTL